MGSPEGHDTKLGFSGGGEQVTLTAFVQALFRKSVLLDVLMHHGDRCRQNISFSISDHVARLESHPHLTNKQEGGHLRNIMS